MPENVICSKDPKTGNPVLAITANGDLFTGSGPNGIFRNQSFRGPSDEFSGWAWPQYQPSCAPYCNVRRVGGAVNSLQQFGAWPRGRVPLLYMLYTFPCWTAGAHPSPRCPLCRRPVEARPPRDLCWDILRYFPPRTAV